MPGSGELLDQTPPHDAEAERGLLGAILIAPERVGDVTQLVAASDFYLIRHQTIFGACLELRRDDVPIDPMTLAARLKETGEWETSGVYEYLAELMQSCPTAANARYYGEIVVKHSQARRLRDLARMTILTGVANGRPIDELLAAIRSTVDAIDRGPAAALYPPVVIPLSEVVPEAVRWLWPG